MRRRMIARGLDGTRAGGPQTAAGKAKGKKADKNGERKIAGQKLEELVKLLADIERTVSVLTRRGIRFTEFIDKHYDGGETASLHDPPPGPGEAGDLLRRRRVRETPR